MYRIDDRDVVLPLDGLPAPSAGAPMPQVFANDTDLVLSYEIAPGGDQIAVVRFIKPRAHYFGAPGDESITGHPLASRGLAPYGLFEVRRSSWIRSLTRMDSVHRNHDPRRFETLRHFIFAFHDNTFECIADGVVLAAALPNDGQTAQSLPGLMAKPLS